MKTALSLAPCLCFVLVLACGDSGSGGSGGDGSGNGPSTGGNGSGGNGAASAGGGPSTGGNGSGGGAGPTEPCPSAVSDVPQRICDLYLQDCPDGGTCDIGDGDTSNDTFDPVAMCFEQDGLKGIGDSCGEPAECEAHLTCVGNRCSPFCCPRNPDSCGGGVCSIDVQLQDAEGNDTGYSFKGCSFAPTCDLFMPDSCDAPDESCYLAGEGQTGCAQTGKLAEEAACIYSNDCLEGLACIGPQNEGVCYYLCQDGSEAEPPGMGGCPVGKSCNTNLTSGFDGLGFCD